MSRPILNLVLAALAFPMALYHFIIGDLRLAIPAVMAAVFGLEYAGVPLLGRTVSMEHQFHYSSPSRPLTAGAGPARGRS